ncbi:hypothetical protein QPK24_16015 [Paenibacillus polygoni]|uniref:Zinc-finger n=1 Tax=Paenibacillus polygoni TaxID=3050112 RepID=A0ABY8WXR5_9BACL|nr:hypothetical protein [Paenibacillus polygoni]WIV17910.1 hypothetical protein QPK24_16015 [Paenibacillus polygoni]
MNNRNEDRFTAYIKGTLTEAEREEIDEQLLTDEEALASYLMSLQLLNQNEDLAHQNNNETFTFPEIHSQTVFTKRIMKQVDSMVRREGRKKRIGKLSWQHLLSHKMIHYTVAASITVLFISTGVFDRLAPGNVYKSETQTAQPYSEVLVKKATGWLDTLKPKP